MMPLLPGSGPKMVGSSIAKMIRAGHPRDQAIAAALRMARDEHDAAEREVSRPARAAGGPAQPMEPRRPPLFHAPTSAPKLHTGPIHSAVAGRTDHLPMHVPSGSYVIPADIISAMGEGNTLAGFKHMRRMFGGQPYGGAPGAPYGQSEGPYGERIQNRAAGGRAAGVPIVAAGGEYVLSPAQVRQAGGGDLDMGHRVLDEFVKRMRAKTVKTLTNLPGPKKD